MNLIGPSYNLESRAASVQRTINLVPVPIEPGNERTAWVFKDAPGLVSAVADFATAPPPAPVVEGQEAIQLAFATSWTISPPTGAAEGELLLVLVTTYAGGQIPATVTAGWTRIGAEENPSAGTLKTALFAKIATGSDSLTFNVDASSNTLGSYVYWRISGCDDIAKVDYEWRANVTTTATVAFDELTIAGDAVGTLWLAAWAWHGTIGVTASVFPSGYSDSQQSTAPSNTNRTVSASAHKTAEASAETPGNATLSGNSAAYQSWTIGVRG